VAFLVSLLPGGAALAAARDRAPTAAPVPPVLASLAVTGPRDCASRAGVLALVARRSTRIRFVDGAAAAGGPALRVTLDATPAGAVVGALTVEWPDGTRADRRITAPTCAGPGRRRTRAGSGAAARASLSPAPARVAGTFARAADATGANAASRCARVRPLPAGPRARSRSAPRAR
jgi:hypothetical protein